MLLHAHTNHTFLAKDNMSLSLPLPELRKQTVAALSDFITNLLSLTIRTIQYILPVVLAQQYDYLATFQELYI